MCARIESKLPLDDVKRGVSLSSDQLLMDVKDDKFSLVEDDKFSLVEDGVYRCKLDEELGRRAFTITSKEKKEHTIDLMTAIRQSGLCYTWFMHRWFYLGKNEARDEADALNMSTPSVASEQMDFIIECMKLAEAKNDEKIISLFSNEIEKGSKAIFRLILAAKYMDVKHLSKLICDKKWLISLKLSKECKNLKKRLEERYIEERKKFEESKKKMEELDNLKIRIEDWETDLESMRRGEGWIEELGRTSGNLSTLCRDL